MKEWQTYIDRLDKLQAVFKGNSFVEYLAEEQLESVTRDASARLGGLTRQRYAIEVDSEGGFVMRDDANGGVKRPVTSLSGRDFPDIPGARACPFSTDPASGEYPLQFFFWMKASVRLISICWIRSSRLWKNSSRTICRSASSAMFKSFVQDCRKS